MKKFITTILATIIVAIGYAQTYLPLIGGTLTGDLAINKTNSFIDLNSTSGFSSIGFREANTYAGYISAVSGGGLQFGTGAAANIRYTIDASGNNTWTGGGTFGGALTSYEATATSSSDGFFNANRGSSTYANGIRFQTASTMNWLVGTAGSDIFRIYNYGTSTNALSVDYSTNATTLSGALSGTSATFNGTAASTKTIIFNSGNSIASFIEPGVAEWTIGRRSSNGAFIFNNGGNFAGADVFTIHQSGNVGIGTTDPQGYKLADNGNMIAESVKVKLYANWPDYVFHKDYALKSLSEIEQYIKTNEHLPDIPSASEVKEQGLNLGEMNAKLLQKIEELTLHMIDFNKQMQEMRKENELLKSEIAGLKTGK